MKVINTELDTVMKILCFELELHSKIDFQNGKNHYNSPS
jgi:hypothetical protein